jgi:AcrR family transcriptional regulator
MPRWEPDALGRLQDAALTLFARQGYAGTTTAEIAAQAGLSERTFFNHFANKHDVLFGRTSEAFLQAVTQGVHDAPDDATPLDAVVHGLRAAADVLEGHQPAAARRRQIIEATPELREREEGKSARLVDSVAVALQDRGAAPDQAFLTARAGVVVQQTADAWWTRPGNAEPLRDLVVAALDALRGVVGP